MAVHVAWAEQAPRIKKPRPVPTTPMPPLPPAVIDDQLKSIGRALEHLAEHLIPLAHVGSLREEAHSLEAQTRALQGIAQERAQRVLGQIREAVSDEMVLPIDLSKGVAGALLARAKELMERAVRFASEADDLEQNYRDRYNTPRVGK